MMILRIFRNWFERNIYHPKKIFDEFIWILLRDIRIFLRFFSYSSWFLAGIFWILLIFDGFFLDISGFFWILLEILICLDSLLIKIF